MNMCPVCAQCARKDHAITDNHGVQICGWKIKQPQIQEFFSTNVYPLDTLPGMKDSGLRIRIERALREEFLRACREQDKPAAQVLRDFMREYVAANQRDGTKALNLKKAQTSKSTKTKEGPK